MLLSLSVDFHHADVSTRERFHPSVEQLAKLYDTSRSRPGAELTMVATCNRSELYAWHTEGDPDEACSALASRWVGRPSEARALLATATRRSGAQAARHLLRVAAGLESQVLGDGQILGQIRGAYRLAAETGAAGPVLHRLFDTALRTGKCVQSETAISLGRNSVGAEAAALAAHRFGTLTHTRVVVVGSGVTGERAARQLVKLGARDAIKPLREALTATCRREVAYAAGEEAADRITDRIVAKLLARPMDALRRAAAEGRSTDELARALAELFVDRRAVPRGAPLHPLLELQSRESRP
jgi:glutamyl-tRNA reductase